MVFEWLLLPKKAVVERKRSNMQVMLERIVAPSLLVLALARLIVWVRARRKTRAKANSDRWAARTRKIQAEWLRDENERLAYLLGRDQEAYQEEF